MAGTSCVIFSLFVRVAVHPPELQYSNRIRRTNHYITSISLSMDHILHVCAAWSYETPLSIALLRLCIDPRPRVPPILVTPYHQTVGAGLVLCQQILRYSWSYPGNHPDGCPAQVQFIFPLQARVFIPPNPGGHNTNDHWRYVALRYRHTIIRGE